VEGAGVTRTFQNEPAINLYDRHDYKLVYDNGNEVIFDNYESVKLTWFQHSGNFLSYVEVLDKQKHIKGFK
jgi:hypothetical protein